VKRVAVIEGEDAAPEAMRPTVGILKSLRLPVEFLYPPVGLSAQEKFGDPFPEEAKRIIDGSDSALFGATSGPSARALFYLRWGRKTYANVRPVRWLSGARSPLRDPKGINFVIVRENMEDMYVGIEGDLAALPPEFIWRATGRAAAEAAPGKYAVKVITEAGTRRVAEFACRLAEQRHKEGLPGKVTVGTKHNMLFQSDGLFRQVAESVVAEHPGLTFESFIVDDLARRLVSDPRSFDVILLPNLYGDILSDEASALMGGLGLAPSGCYGEDYAYFEGAGGSAPDIAGQNIVNPTATLLSAAMMLDYLSFDEEAARLAAAVEAVYREGTSLTPDQGGTAKTTEFCAAVRRSMSA
jgi:isocitrate/isopropylmalate dehydrogenase